MDLLTPNTVPFIFIGIAVVFLGMYLFHRRNADQPIAQRNRLRMAAIFAIVGGGHLIWRWLH